MSDFQRSLSGIVSPSFSVPIGFVAKRIGSTTIGAALVIPPSFIAKTVCGTAQHSTIALRLGMDLSCDKYAADKTTDECQKHCYNVAHLPDAF